MTGISLLRFQRWLLHPIITLLCVCLAVFSISMFIIHGFENNDDLLREYFLHLDHPASLEHTSDSIRHYPLPHVNNETLERIPRIVHQTYSNSQVPKKWQAASKSCKNVHEEGNWTHVLWTDQTARKFIEESYPWFLKTYDGYPYEIQRVDAVRYFIIYHFGGFYLDLDIGCLKPLTPLLPFDAVFPKTQPSGVSNDMMAAVKGHQFFKQLITELPRHSRRVGTKYTTVMWTAGPVFVTQQLARYLRIGEFRNVATGAASDEVTVHIIPHVLYGSAKSSFFTHHPGSSWHGWDVQSSRVFVEECLKNPWFERFCGNVCLLPPTAFPWEEVENSIPFGTKGINQV
ncbi:hypothetical protein AK830_g3351 [Neonectria ditissima]|uniref:Mannosyl phosphorylinositol ceramide synthase SUR1 n=1 Tax=Neonectria ditissima TaxID=78410 RepID=A0A0P7BC90_9HYPO|nr:hypothetical protein AK830_g3351 [Neonectria ditissima]